MEFIVLVRGSGRLCVAVRGPKSEKKKWATAALAVCGGTGALAKLLQHRVDLLERRIYFVAHLSTDKWQPPKAWSQTLTLGGLRAAKRRDPNGQSWSKRQVAS